MGTKAILGSVALLAIFGAVNLGTYKVGVEEGRTLEGASQTKNLNSISEISLDRRSQGKELPIKNKFDFSKKMMERNMAHYMGLASRIVSGDVHLRYLIDEDYPITNVVHEARNIDLSEEFFSKKKDSE